MSSRVCLIIYDLPVYISSCLFSLMSSGLLVIPGVSCLWVLPCPALMSLLNIIIWVYIFVCVFLPRVCTVTEDQTKTVSGAHSPSFVFRFEKFLFCSSVCVCLSRGMEVAARHSRHSPLQVGVGVRWDRRECRESSGLWLNARRPASDSMPADPPLTQCPPDCRWLKPTGSALIHARWPPLSLAPWI